MHYCLDGCFSFTLSYLPHSSSDVLSLSLNLSLPLSPFYYISPSHSSFLCLYPSSPPFSSVLPYHSPPPFLPTSLSLFFSCSPSLCFPISALIHLLLFAFGSLATITKWICCLSYFYYPLLSLPTYFCPLLPFYWVSLLFRLQLLLLPFCLPLFLSHSLPTS